MAQPRVFASANAEETEAQIELVLLVELYGAEFNSQ